MPEYGHYEKIPRPESIQQFIEYLSTNKHIFEVEQTNDQVLQVKRTRLSSLSVFMTNIYIVGLADVYEILTKEKALDAIVTMSAWNGYTSEAKEHCKEQRIGLFTFKEFLGAVHYGGNNYLDYISPDERRRKSQHRG